MHLLSVPLVAVGCLMLTGCATRHRPATNWQLKALGQGHVLVPPKPPTGRAIELENARNVNNKNPECAIEGRQIRLVWRGRKAQLTIDPGVVAPQGPVVASGGPMRLAGTLASDQSWWAEFGGELKKREAGRCLGSGEAELLSKRIIENIAMPSSQAFHLRYGNFPRTGYLDLEPWFELKYVSPILKPGVTQYTGLAGVAGYETAYYGVSERAGGGVKVTLRAVEHNIGRSASRVREPATMRLHLPDSGRHVRYFFREWRVAGDRKIALLATSRKDALDSLTRRFEADPDDFCKTVGSAEATCISIPREAVLTPETALRVNGQLVSVIIAGTVGDAARAAGVKKQEEILPTLHILRPYEGMMLPVEFDRRRSDVLRLVLIGGEEVRW